MSNKQTFAIRLEPELIEKIKQLAPEGNVSLWIRTLIKKELETKENK